MCEYRENVKKNFGFGCMRLPLLEDESVDKEQFSEMIDTFMENGFNYFDTAHGYLSGKSETAIRDCLASRYPRDSFILTDKLSEGFFQKEEDIIPFFESQLEACGVSYFDYYLMHAMNAEFYPKYTKCRAFEIAKELKEQGRIRHIGMSFHDSAEVLDMILSEHPEIEVVQLQFNYVDYDSPEIQSKLCYDVCVKHKKPVIVMEPVKGGVLVNLPPSAQRIIDALNGGSNASYAIRFCASFDQVFMVLSGMSDMAQMNDNMSYMRDFEPLSDKEFDAVEKIREIINSDEKIGCTACRYCVDGCPKNISIPDLFACYNERKKYTDKNRKKDYDAAVNGKGKASDCIKCGKCEYVCPQHLKIRDLLVEVAEWFES